MPPRAAPGSRQIAKVIKTLSDVHGLRDAALRLGVSPSTVGRLRRTITGNVKLHEVIGTGRTVERWIRRIEAANPRLVIHDILRTYGAPEIARVTGATTRTARNRLRRLYDMAATDPARAMLQAVELEKKLREEGFEVVNGLRLYRPDSPLIPERREYRKTFFALDDAVDWANTITGAAAYCFAVRYDGRIDLYIDLDRVSPPRKEERIRTARERRRIAREAALIRWHGTSDKEAIRAIREYKRRQRE